MAIIVSRDGENAKRIEPAAFQDEAALQAYVTANPEALPLGEINESIRLLVLAREFPTNSGPIDALGIDQDGVLYIIETKLYKNPDKRRVLAQVLDYGAALWRHGADLTEFASRLEPLVAKQFEIGLTEKLSEFFGIAPEATAELMDGAHACLREGRFRFVVLMDTIDDRLKDLILFVNQNSQFDVYGVELEYYRHEGYEILIPRLYGAEVRKANRTGTATRKRWTEETFFEALRGAVSRECFGAIRELYEFGQNHGDSVWFGTGTVNGSFLVALSGKPGSALYVMTDGSLYLVYNIWSAEEKALLAKTANLPGMDTNKGCRDSPRMTGSGVQVRSSTPFADSPSADAQRRRG